MSRSAGRQMRLVAPVLASLLALGVARADEPKAHEHLGVDPDLLAKRGDHTKVVNGCGPGNLQIADEHNRFANKHTYTIGGGRGDYIRYVVDFVDACNLHDAGYAGETGVLTTDGGWMQTLVYDKILDMDIDYSNKSRKWVDDHFLADMVAECEQQLKGQDARGLKEALDACKHHGQAPKIGGAWGAETLYQAVREYGMDAYDDLEGKRTNDDPLPHNPRGTYRDDW